MNIKTQLEMWGNWARCQTGTDWQGISAGFQNMESAPRAMGLRCDDDRGMIVDSAVAGLRHYDVLAYKLVIAHYVFRISQSKLAKQLGKAQSYVTGMMRIAEAFIAGQIFVETGEALAVQ